MDKTTNKMNENSNFEAPNLGNKVIDDQGKIIHVPKIFLNRDEARRVIEIFLFLDKKKEVKAIPEYQELKKIVTEREALLGMKIFIVIGRVVRKAKDTFSSVNAKYAGQHYYILTLDNNEHVYLAKH